MKGVNPAEAVAMKIPFCDMYKKTGDLWLFLRHPRCVKGVNPAEAVATKIPFSDMYKSDQQEETKFLCRLY